MKTTISLFHVYVTPPIEKTFERGRMFGTDTKFGPFQARPTF